MTTVEAQPAKKLRCPTPDKDSHPDKAAAEHHACRRAQRIGALLKPYLCRCGAWHLTRRGAVREGDPHATPGTVAALDDRQFLTLADFEVRGLATPAEGAALRDPLNIVRWRAALKQLWVISGAVLAERQGRDAETRAWRRRRLAYDNAIRRRREQAKAIQARIHAERRSNPEAYVLCKRGRRDAYETAVARLIAAHADEFDVLLAEEREAVARIGGAA